MVVVAVVLVMVHLQAVQQIDLLNQAIQVLTDLEIQEAVQAQTLLDMELEAVVVLEQAAAVVLAVVQVVPSGLLVELVEL